VALAADPAIDVFIELMGGEGDPAKTAVETALMSGKHVITATRRCWPITARRWHGWPRTRAWR